MDLLDEFEVSVKDVNELLILIIEIKAFGFSVKAKASIALVIWQIKCAKLDGFSMVSYFILDDLLLGQLPIVQVLIGHTLKMCR